MARNKRDPDLKLVERTGSHEPVSRDSPLGTVAGVDDAPGLDESIDTSSKSAGLEDPGTMPDPSVTQVVSDPEPSELAAAAEAAALLDPEEAARLEQAADSELNDRTLAQPEGLPGLFADIPDPEDAPLPQPTIPTPDIHEAETDYLPVLRPQAIPVTSAPGRPVAKAKPKPKPKPGRPKARAPARPPPVPGGRPASRREPPARTRSEPSVIFALEEDDFSAEMTGVYSPPEKRSELPRGRLVVIGGEHAGKTWYLNRNRVRIGRGTENDIVLLDIAASRQHLRMDRHATGYRIEDLNSGNGTWINGRRINRAEVYDGDRVEVGNTVLEFSTVGTPRVRDDAEPSRATDPGAAIAVSPIRSRGVPVVWLVAWALVTFVAVVGGMYATRKFLEDDDPAQAAPQVDEAAQSRVKQAEAALAAREWASAVEALEVARQLDPEAFDQQATLANARAELSAQQALEQARSKLGRAPYGELEALLQAVPEASVYALDKRALLVEARREDLKQRAAAAQQALDKGHQEHARTLAESVLKIDASHAAARKVLEAVQAKKPEGATPDGSTPATEPARPKPVDPGRAAERAARRHIDAGTRHYKKGRFEDAIVSFQRAARAPVSKRTRGSAGARAKWVRSFQRAWDTGRKAVRERRQQVAASELESALRLDRKLGGHFGSRVRKQLAVPYHFRAVQAFSRRDYRRAGALNEKVMKFDPSHELARLLRSKLDSVATRFLRNARSERDPQRRRKLAQDAADCALPGSNTRREAERLLR